MSLSDVDTVEAKAAEANAALARARLGRAVDRIHGRVSPERLIEDTTSAVSGEVERGVNAARNSLQQHPVAVGFAGAMLGLATIRRLIRTSTD